MATKVRVSAKVNGEEVDFLCDPRQSLLECLRDVLNLTGTKEGCNDGNCGACSVLLNGRLVNSCLVLGVEIDGQEVTTVEGLADSGHLHPLQQAFLDNAAIQCGYCTPGMLIASKALLDRNPNPTEERDPLLAGGEPVPVHRLRQDRAGGDGRRGAHEGSKRDEREGQDMSEADKPVPVIEHSAVQYQGDRFSADRPGRSG